MDFLLEFWRFILVRKKFWLLPVLILMLAVGGLLILAHGSVLAPFVYTLF